MFRSPGGVPETEEDYRAYDDLVPRDVASRAVKVACDEGHGVGSQGLGVYREFASAIARLGVAIVRERYGNLFEMCERITGHRARMRIYPAAHYTMSGLCSPEGVRLGQAALALGLRPPWLRKVAVAHVDCRGRRE
jgi:succinate dehydrogenase / fumarate reductase flavoprotein subunit